MQYVCKTIRFNFEPTLRSNKICLYVRHLKRGRKKIKPFNSLVPAKLWHLFSLFFIPLLQTLNPRKTEFLRNPLFLPAVYAKAQCFQSTEIQVQKMMIARLFLYLRWTLLLLDWVSTGRQTERSTLLKIKVLLNAIWLNGFKKNL